MRRELSEMEMFRAQELLMQRATTGLDPQEAAELDALGADHDIGFDLAAAAIDIATLRIEEMPIGVADKILVAANVPLYTETSDTTVMSVPPIPQTLAGFMPPRPIVTGQRPAVESSVLPPTTVEPHVPTPLVEPPPPKLTMTERPAPGVIPIDAAKFRRRTRLAAAIGVFGMAAAAAAIIYVTQRPPEIVKEIVTKEIPTPPPKAKTSAEERSELLASATDLTTLEWTATKDPNATGAKGDIVWSKTAQKGFMRFTGLATNDPTKLQYQLWIFDKNRPQETPVDGGVFDISATGEVIIPIAAKLSVDEPVLFAVTIERPGGVVVSKRERVVVTATPKTG
ncbi:MAG: anti-sigma factor domain-containing protein [Kofleriaceae bacterium]